MAHSERTLDATQQRLKRLERLESELREVNRELKRISDAYRRLLEPATNNHPGRS
jgi:predicted nuclease with TOPRIM domain